MCVNEIQCSLNQQGLSYAKYFHVHKFPDAPYIQTSPGFSARQQQEQQPCLEVECCFKCDVR